MTIGRAHKWIILNGLQNEQCTFGHIHAGQRSRFAKSHLRPITARPVWSQQSINTRSLRFDRFTARPKGQGLRAAQRRPCATLSRTLDQLELLQLPRSDQLTWLSQTGFARLAKPVKARQSCRFGVNINHMLRTKNKVSRLHRQTSRGLLRTLVCLLLTASKLGAKAKLCRQGAACYQYATLSRKRSTFKFRNFKSTSQARLRCTVSSISATVLRSVPASFR